MKNFATIARIAAWLVATAMVSLLPASPASAQNGTLFAAPLIAAKPVSTTTLDQLYYLQPHNTYEHGKVFSAWLDRGYRAVEIDVTDSPFGWWLGPDGPVVAHAISGRTNCKDANSARLYDCLNAIVAWRRANTTDPTPLLVFVDMKWNPSSLWKEQDVARLDEYIGRTIPLEYRYTYADLMTYLSGQPGNSPRAKLKGRGWPTTDALRNKIVVLLTGGNFASTNQNMNAARRLLASSVKKQSTFFCPDVDAGDPGEISGKIDGISETDSGYFLCANMKAGDHGEQVLNRSAEYRQLLHLWGHSGDFSNKDYAYAYIGVAHGVSVLGMDMDESLSSANYYVPEWINRIPFVGVRRNLPGYFMMPTMSSERQGCVDVNGARFQNRSTIIQSSCHGGLNQQFVYTAEGQLRPKGSNKYCLDVKNGASKEAVMHLWDCDGGPSEKWHITADGLMVNQDADRRFCMDVFGGSPASGTAMKLWPCDKNDRAQQLNFRQMPDWYPTEF